MDWKKSKLTRWTAGTFTITEEINGARPFRLDGPDDSPQHFETLTEAKAHASTLNELEVYKAEVRRLRAELDTKAGRWPADAMDLEAEAGAEAAAEDDDQAADDGRGIPLRINGHTSPLVSAGPLD